MELLDLVILTAELFSLFMSCTVPTLENCELQMEYDGY